MSIQKTESIFKSYPFDKVCQYKMSYNRLNYYAQGDANNLKFIYLMVDDHTGLIKIGISKDPNIREKTLLGQAPLLRLIDCWPGDYNDEKYLHERYKDKRVRGEWFALTLKDIEFLRFENGLPIENGIFGGVK